MPADRHTEDRPERSERGRRIRLPDIESAAFYSWERHVAENPELAASPEIVRRNFEKSRDDIFGMVMYLASF